MAKSMPSPADVAQRWQQGFSNSGQKWLAGVQAVERAPGIDAQAARDRYLQGVNSNADKYAANVAKVTKAEWVQACQTKGQPRLASGATAGAAKYQTKIGPVLQAIGQLRDTLPPRGDIMANLNRVAHMAVGLQQRAQQGW